jgi:hypothetical protein
MLTEVKQAVETQLITVGERQMAREMLARKAEHVTPTGVTLPRPWEEYRLEGEFTDHAALIEVVQDALEDITLTPQRYAELMWLIDSWLVEGHDGHRRHAIVRGQEVFRGR